MVRLISTAASVLAVAALACAPETEPRYLEDGITLPTVSGVRDVHENPAEPAPCVATVYHMFARAGDHIWHCPIYDRGEICRDDKHWLTAIDGAVQSVDKIASGLVAEGEKLMESAPDPVVGIRLSARRVLIRADERAPFGKINKLVELCSSAKIYKIDFAAQFGSAEGELQGWLPKFVDDADPDFVDVRVELRWNESQRWTSLRFRERGFAADAELQLELHEFLAQVMRLHTVAPPLTIDSTDRVPWREVVAVIPVARRAGFEELEFALGDSQSDH